MAEIYLISGDFNNALELSHDLLNNKNLSSDYILAMRTVSSISFMLQNKIANALEEINKLIAYYKSLDKDYERGWGYNEIKEFIKNNKQLYTAQTQVISTLIEILEYPNPDELEF